nr:hypothetical protein [Tanacetum cinerariifolium]
MRIEQYFLMTDYPLSEVILNGDSPAPTRVIEGIVQPVVPTTAEHRLARKNELKAHGTLLMALLDKHQLNFNIHKDAKNLMEAIEKRFRGNKETKKLGFDISGFRMIVEVETQLYPVDFRARAARDPVRMGWQEKIVRIKSRTARSINSNTMIVNVELEAPLSSLNPLCLTLLNL